jgi:hypothetical protein
MADLSDIFFSSSPSEIASGYAESESGQRYRCLVCGHEAERGVIYKAGEAYFEAERYMRGHVESEHGPMLDFLLGLDKRLTGLGDQQRRLISLFYEGREDREAALAAGISASTVRNHRFALREKAKQARVFLAIMELLGPRTPVGGRFISVRRNAAMVDERYAITEEEGAAIIDKYFKDGKLIEFPVKEKRKIAILSHIAGSFEAGRRYSEKEVNEVLKAFFADYVTLRRYLIEYGYLDRKPDGSAYWLEE